MPQLSLFPYIFFYGMGTGVVDAKTNAYHIKEKEENPHEDGGRGESEGQTPRLEEEEGKTEESESRNWWKILSTWFTNFWSSEVMCSTMHYPCPQDQ